MELTEFNLKEDAERGAEYILLNPRTGAPEDVTINLKGADSPTHDKLLREEQSRKVLDGDDYDVNAGVMRLTAGLVINWEGLKFNGKEFKCTPENVIEFFSKQEWAYEQVQRFVEGRLNFFLIASPKKEKA